MTNRILRALFLPFLVLLLAACGGGDDNGAPLRLSGALQQPGDYYAQDLQRLPAFTQTDSYLSSGSTQTHTYTGALSWSVLDHAGIVLDATRKNDVLNRYVLATGSDGYRVVFALGELDPDFGNKASIVAYGETLGGFAGPVAAADGPFRITAPGDVRGGRYVSKLVRLDVRTSGSAVAGGAGGVSTSFTVSGDVKQTRTFDLTALQSLPAVTQTVGTTVYTGVSLWTLLNTTLGLKTDASAKNPTLAMYAVATGSDGYKAMVSLGEIDPGFGNRNTIVAYAANGAALGSTGDARLIVPGEVKQGRSVSNLVAIEVFTAPAN